jgi:hypothetical protein
MEREAMHLEQLTFLLLLGAVLYVMMVAGVEKRALEWKRQRRTCPSCGRDARNCRCRAPYP